jgi:hypothetical protein
MGIPYNGADNADDTLVSAWNTPGWTAQNIPGDTIQATPGLFSAAPFPTDIIFAQLVGAYFDFDGNPLSGFLTFMMSEGITITDAGKSYRIPARYAGRDNSMTPSGLMNWGTGRIYIRQGAASVTILCSQQTGLVTDSGAALTYHVTEHFLGGRQYDISVPSNTVSPADLFSLIIPGSVLPYSYDPADPLANEGYTPIVPVLSAGNDIDGGGA